jgi:hypothetical protein
MARVQGTVRPVAGSNKQRRFTTLLQSEELKPFVVNIGLILHLL